MLTNSRVRSLRKCLLVALELSVLEHRRREELPVSPMPPILELDTSRR
jgi:hypothetical protein